MREQLTIEAIVNSLNQPSSIVNIYQSSRSSDLIEINVNNALNVERSV